MPDVRTPMPANVIQVPVASGDPRLAAIRAAVCVKASAAGVAAAYVCPDGCTTCAATVARDAIVEAIGGAQLEEEEAPGVPRGPAITDAILAVALIERLNRLIEDPDVRADLARILATRVPTSRATFVHPTIQVRGDAPESGTVGLLGLLNGIVGTLPDGPRKGWGYITAALADDGALLRFELTDSGRTP